MAETVFPAGDPASVVLYSELTYAQAIRYTTASKLMAVGLSKDDPSNFVQYFEETSEKNGDQIKYDLIYNPFGQGVAGDSVIAGQEVALTYDQAAIFINQLRQAMLLKGMMSQQRVPFSIRDKARNGLSNWFRTMIEYGLCNQAAGNVGATRLPYLNGAVNAPNPSDAGAYNYTGMQSPFEPSSDHTIFPAGATTEATVGTDPKYGFNLDLIPDLVAMAQGNLGVPIKPVIINGLEIAGVAFLDHLQVKDLKKNFSQGEWGDLMRAALQGGQVQGNPIFTGALGIFDNTVLHQSTYLPWGDGAASNLVLNPQSRQMVAAPNSLYGYSYATQYIGRFIFLGAQALALAVGMADGTPENPLRVKWVEEPLDGNNQLRIINGMIWGIAKTQFAGSDYAVITGSTYVNVAST